MQTAKLGRPVIIAPCQTNCSCRSTVSPSTDGRDAAEGQQLEPGRGDHDVGLEHPPAPQPDPLGDERVDVVGDHLGLAALDRPEQVGVGHRAEPLVPGVVRRGEVLGDQRGVPEILLVQAGEHLAGAVGEALAEVVEAQLMSAMFLVRISRCASRGRQLLAEPVGDLVAARDADRSSWGCAGAWSRGRRRSAIAGTRVTAVAPLPMITTRLPAYSRSSGQNCGCTTSAGEGVEAGERRAVALVVVVVARAGVEEAARHRASVRPASRAAASTARARSTSRRRRPWCGSGCAARCRTPRRCRGCRTGSSAVRDRLRRPPRLELVAEREHVGVRADPGIAEQVPGAAHRLARLEHREGAVGALGVQSGTPRRCRTARPRRRRRRRAPGSVLMAERYRVRSA